MLSALLNFLLSFVFADYLVFYQIYMHIYDTSWPFVIGLKIYSILTKDFNLNAIDYLEFIVFTVSWSIFCKCHMCLFSGV
jgi:hypothetical protein